MTAICAIPFKLPAARVTLLDSCGNVAVSQTGSISVTGVIEIAETTNFEDREEFFQKNGDGQFCVQATNEPIMKYKELVVQFCVTDPELVNIIAGEPIVLDDTTATPLSVGWRSRQGSAQTVNFALEGWTRITNANPCGTPAYGYVLYPYCVGGVIDDVTWGNSNYILTVKCRTAQGPGWGVGPYNVIISKAATLTTGQPSPLLSAITANDHRLFEWTQLAPPANVCGGQPTQLNLPTITKVALVATLTFPSPNAHLPAIINWGDGTADTTVTTGTSTTHTYGAGGTYNVTYNPTTEGSGPPWKGSITVP